MTTTTTSSSTSQENNNLDDLVVASLEDTEVLEGEEEDVEGRSTRWGIDDSLTLVEAVDEVGKGDWERVMQMCHGKHKCTNYTNKDQYRKHFNSLNEKRNAIWKPFKFPKFKPKKGVTSKQRILQAEREHGAKYQHISDQRDRMRGLLHAINEREKQKSTEERDSIDKSKKELKEKAEERRRGKDERLEKYEEEAKKDKEFKQGMMESMGFFKSYLDQSLELEKVLLKNILKKRRRNQDTDDDTDSSSSSEGD